MKNGRKIGAAMDLNEKRINWPQQMTHTQTHTSTPVVNSLKTTHTLCSASSVMHNKHAQVMLSLD